MDYTAEISIGLRRKPKEALITALSKLSSSLVIPERASQIVIKPSIYDPQLVGNTNFDLVQAIVRTFSSLGRISIVESNNPIRTTFIKKPIPSFARPSDQYMYLVHDGIVKYNKVD